MTIYSPSDRTVRMFGETAFVSANVSRDWPRAASREVRATDEYRAVLVNDLTGAAWWEIEVSWERGLVLVPAADWPQADNASRIVKTRGGDGYLYEITSASQAQAQADIDDLFYRYPPEAYWTRVVTPPTQGPDGKWHATVTRAESCD